MNKVSIYGGLGNQMFQYALYRALKNRDKKTDLYLADFFYLYHHNGFNIYKAFNLKLSFNSFLEAFILENFEFLYKNKIGNTLSRRIVQFYKNKLYKKYHEKKEFEFDEELFNQESCLLIGTWQVESYFLNIKNILKQEFIFKTPTDFNNKDLIKEIKNSNSVSIHVRRRDFQSKEWINSHCVIKDRSYYINAFNYIENKVENIHYFMFSDDLEWVRENLKLENCTYVDFNNGKHSYIDMYLMSLCKHNIIANSTFSWWGAWLNNNENKIVIMPERWLNDCSCNGIFINEWVKMPV